VKKLNKSVEISMSSFSSRWKRFIRISGVLAIIMAILWVAVSYMSMNLYRMGLPTTTIGFLQLFSQHQALAATTWSLWIVADIILVPITIALYILLKPVSKSLAVGGAILTLAFCIYDPLVSELQSLRLVGYSQTYLAATTEAAKASVITNASGIVNALPLMTFISYFLTIGPLLFAIVMVKSNQFRRRTAVFGVITNLMAVIGAFNAIGVSSFIVGLLFLVSVPAVALWFILVGAQMIRNYRKTAAALTQPATSKQV
jgi:hypothetical protein